MSTLNKFALVAALIGVSVARGDGLSGSVAPHPNGGISMGFDGGISGIATNTSTPVTPCSQTGLIFTSGCNAILYVVLF